MKNEFRNHAALINGQFFCSLTCITHPSLPCRIHYEPTVLECHLLHQLHQQGAFLHAPHSCKCRNYSPSKVRQDHEVKEEQRSALPKASTWTEMDFQWFKKKATDEARHHKQYLTNNSETRTTTSVMNCALSEPLKQMFASLPRGLLPYWKCVCQAQTTRAHTHTYSGCRVELAGAQCRTRVAVKKKRNFTEVKHSKLMSC